MLDTSEANFLKVVLKDSGVIFSGLMTLGMSQMILLLHSTAFVPVTDDNHNKNTTVRLHGSRDADLHRMMCGGINHFIHSLIGYNRMSYKGTCWMSCNGKEPPDVSTRAL
ncbi:hypothetical protein BRD19_04000 [Halobacteriales archaeon SW_7_65_23]|nr:MAG: hypothetical protein BRD19_04000 [Halobacteriales archaeon SW_7_65_23]